MALAAADIAAPIARRSWLREAFRRHPTVIAGIVILVAMVLMAILAPYLGTVDPVAVAATSIAARSMAPASRSKWAWAWPSSAP